MTARKGEPHTAPDGIGHKTAIDELVSQYLIRCEREVHMARGLLDRKDLAGLEALGHEMAGSGESFGFPIISNVGCQIVEAVRDADATAIREAVRELEEYLQRLQRKRSGGGP